MMRMFIIFYYKTYWEGFEFNSGQGCGLLLELVIAQVQKQAWTQVCYHLCSSFTLLINTRTLSE